jgi:hypothetical protein
MVPREIAGAEHRTRRTPFREELCVKLCPTQQLNGLVELWE